MNSVCLLGRLTRDPEVRSGNGTVARYGLAVNRPTEGTDFINIVAFGKGAEFAVKYLHKGMQVAITGRIQTGSYETRDGQKRTSFDVVAEKQDFAEKKNSEDAKTTFTPTEEPMPEQFEEQDELPF